MGRDERIAKLLEDPMMAAFHKLIPIGTPVLWTNKLGYKWRGTVAGGVQEILYSDYTGSYHLPQIHVYEDGSDDLTNWEPKEMEFYIEERWMKYDEAMKRIV